MRGSSKTGECCDFRPENMERRMSNNMGSMLYSNLCNRKRGSKNAIFARDTRFAVTHNDLIC